MGALTPLGFLRRACDVYPDKVAVVDSAAGDLTYRQLRERADLLANALRSVGVVPGERVAVLAPNGRVLLESHFGVPGAGAVLVALNTRLAADEHAYILRHSESRVVIVHASLVHVVDELRSRLDPDVVVVECGSAEPASGHVGYEPWLSAAGSGEGMVDPDNENALIALNYTSGTTGMPKGVMYTHRGAFLNSLGSAMSMALRPDSVYLWTLPMFHCNGWCFTWAVTAMGARHVCLPRPDPEVVLDSMQADRVTHFCGAPVVLNALVTHPSAAAVTFDHRIQGAVGGAPPSPTVIAAAERMGMEITHLYGMTETYGPSLVCEPQPEWADLPLDDRAARMSRQGVRTVVVRDVRVVDDDMADVPADATTVGEIVVDSATVMAGYFRDEEATAYAMRGGLLHTGDLAVWYPDGYIAIRDRAKDLIISGGENISSIEVEHALVAHPSVAEAAVIARPDDRWGEVPIAFVALVPGETTTAEELREFVQGRLARFKAPRDVYFVDLPKTSTGKVQKHVLRRLSASPAGADPEDAVER